MALIDWFRGSKVLKVGKKERISVKRKKTDLKPALGLVARCTDAPDVCTFCAHASPKCDLSACTCRSTIWEHVQLGKSGRPFVSLV